MNKKTIFMSVFATAFAGVVSVYAQKGNMGLNNTDPKATLHIDVASNAPANSVQGIIIPNVTTARVTAMGTSAPESTLVYITDGATGTGTTSNVDGKGFYYYNTSTSKWVKIGSGSGATLPTGTASGQVLKWNGSAWVAGTDNVGSTLPSTATAGQVLTWDATSSSWVAQTPASGGGTDTSIYKADGELTEARKVTQKGNDLKIVTGTTASNIGTDYVTNPGVNTTGNFIVDGTTRLLGGAYVNTMVITDVAATQYIVQPNDYFISVNGPTAQVNVQVPKAATSNKGRVLVIVNNTASNVTLKDANSDQVLGNTDVVAVATGRGVMIVSDGTKWYNTTGA